MKKTILISAAVLAYCILLTAYCYPQGAAINTTGVKADSSAILDVSSTAKGMLVPRMTDAQKSAIVNPSNGLLIYQTDISGSNDTGFYYYKYNRWEPVSGSGSSGSAVSLDFTFTADKTSVMVGAGTNGNTSYDPVTLSLTYSGGNGSAVTISVQGLPAGASIYSLSPCGGFPTFTSTLALAITPSVAPGDYPFTIVASGGISPKTITDTLKVITGKKVFATSTYYNGSLGGLTGADGSCMTRAGAAGLSGTFKAWLSTPVELAKNRINDGLYIRTDGAVIAKNKADLLDGTLYCPINKTEFGANQTSNAVWTNSHTDGTLVDAAETCSNWTSSGGYSKIGNPQSTTGWTYTGWEECNGGNPYPNVVLYCFEQ